MNNSFRISDIQVWRPKDNPPFFRKYSDISAENQQFIFWLKKEYEREEEEYLTYVQETSRFSNNFEILDCKHYLESNIYYQKQQNQYLQGRESSNKSGKFNGSSQIQSQTERTKASQNATPLSDSCQIYKDQRKSNRIHKELFPSKEKVERLSNVDYYEEFMTPIDLYFNGNPNECHENHSQYENYSFSDSSCEARRSLPTTASEHESEFSETSFGQSVFNAIHINDKDSDVADHHISYLEDSRSRNMISLEDNSSYSCVDQMETKDKKYDGIYRGSICPGAGYLERTRSDMLPLVVNDNPIKYNFGATESKDELSDTVYGSNFCHNRVIPTFNNQNSTANQMVVNEFLSKPFLYPHAKIVDVDAMMPSPKRSPATVDKSNKTLSSLSRKLIDHQQIRLQLKSDAHQQKCFMKEKENEEIESFIKGEELTSRNELKKSKNSVKTSKRCIGNSNAVSDFKKLKSHPSTAVHFQVGVDNGNETEVLHDNRFIDVSKLPEDGKRNLQSCLLQADSLSFTIIYNDGSTLITTGHQQQENNKKKLAKNSGKSIDKWAKCICGAIRGGPFKEYKDQLLVFPLEDESETKEYFSWFSSGVHTFREMILKIFKEREIIIFDAQRIIITLIEVFHLQDVHKKETENWEIQDPLLGTWLLDANKSPKTFLEVLRFAKLTPINHKVVGRETCWYIKANLLLMMSAVKKINALLKEQNIYKLYMCVETKLIPILACMETARFKIEMSTVAKFSDILKKKLLKLETQAFHATGHSFSINSHSQLRQVLYEELQLDKKLPSNCKMVKTSVAHQKSTSESMLSQMAAYHPLPNIILEYRQLQKLKSTYVDGMMSCIEKGYLSTHWDQIAAATGRLSSYHPNIQAIPKASVTLTNYMDNFIEGKHDESKMDIYAREPFISHKGWVLLAADFQQIELRLLAHLSKDEQLLSIFDDGNCKDIFITLTSQWLCKAYDKISQVEREQTKRIVYSVMYGVGKDRLADYLKVSPDNAKAIMNSFLIKFPAVNRFTKTCVEFCKKNGFTSTLFGRRRYVPNIRSFNPVLRAQAERQCVNFCVQGSAADLCKSAMIKVEFALQNFNSRLLVQIHDELVWEVPESQIADVTEIVKRIMEDGQELCKDIATLSVPIAVTVSTGRSWAHLKTALFTPELRCRNS